MTVTMVTMISKARTLRSAMRFRSVRGDPMLKGGGSASELRRGLNLDGQDRVAGQALFTNVPSQLLRGVRPDLRSPCISEKAVNGVLGDLIALPRRSGLLQIVWKLFGFF